MNAVTIISHLWPLIIISVIALLYIIEVLHQAFFYTGAKGEISNEERLYRRLR